MNLSPFDATKSCPKCGSSDIGTTYHRGVHHAACTVPGEAVPAGGGPRWGEPCCDFEHLEHRCERCGFGWAEIPLTRPAEPAPTSPGEATSSTRVDLVVRATIEVDAVESYIGARKTFVAMAVEAATARLKGLLETGLAHFTTTVDTESGMTLRVQPVSWEVSEVHFENDAPRLASYVPPGALWDLDGPSKEGTP